ncbi:MAG: class I SAM-dependent methyltransferase [Pseudomonadota bacterium]
MTEWYASFFSGPFADLWRQAMSDENSNRETAFLIDWLDAPAGSTLLDVPCGHGRHAARLARAGYALTGIDLSEPLLDAARRETAGLPVTLVQADMRQIPARNPFDGAYCLGNSLAVLDRAGLGQFFAALAHGLGPGARLVLDSSLVAESLLPGFEERIWMPVGDALMLVEQTYDAAEGRLDATYTIIQNDRQESRPAVHWIISVSELRALLDQAGFDTVAVMGDFDASPFALGDEQVVLVAERRG